MRQYSYWLNNLILDVNNLFAYIYSFKAVTSSKGEVQDILRIMNWLCSFKCLLLHNHIPATLPMQEYTYYYTNRTSKHIELGKRLVQGQEQHKLLKVPFQMTVVQTHIDNIIARVEQLLDFAVHNSSTFESETHMHQTLYLLKMLTSGLCPILHSGMVTFEKKDAINKAAFVLYYRIVQISNTRYPNVLSKLQPAFITYVQTGTH